MAAATVEEYLASFPPEPQTVLRGLREAVLVAVPGAEESIRYRMAAFRLGGGTWLHLGGWKRHAGLYPVAPLPSPLEEEVAPYRTTTATVALPYERPVPYDLVTRVVAVLVADGA